MMSTSADEVLGMVDVQGDMGNPMDLLKES